MAYRRFDAGLTGEQEAVPAPLPMRFERAAGGKPLVQVAIGAAAALMAIAIRYSLPLSPAQIPTLTVIVGLALVTTFIGTTAGIVTAALGGLLAWYLFFTPFSWELTSESLIPLLGFWIIAAVIVITSHFYRLSEHRNHEAQLAAVRRQAEAAELFAAEMAHRLKNALAIVQSIAFQTLDDGTADTTKFAARLKALADAHDLLSEHVERPTAKVADVVAAALRPFEYEGERVRVECTHTRIAAQQVVLLALAVHELATNACKFGALSNREGWVSLTIGDAGDRIKLDWSEHGGPEVRPPGASGFGTRLLRRIGGDAEIAFDPAGVRCTIYLRKAV